MSEKVFFDWELYMSTGKAHIKLKEYQEFKKRILINASYDFGAFCKYWIKQIIKKNPGN